MQTKEKERLLSLLTEKPYTVSQLSKKLRIPYSNIYSFFRNHKELFQATKESGLLWLRPTQGLYLNICQAKLKPAAEARQDKNPENTHGAYSCTSPDAGKDTVPFLGRCGPERFAAVMEILKKHIQNFGYTIPDPKNASDKKKRIFVPRNEESLELILENFDNYIDRTSEETLILMPKNDVFGDCLALPNENRFNSSRKKAETRIRYENLFSDAGATYKGAVLLTLTTKQSWHENVFAANKDFQQNWNKLITRLRKEKKDNRLHELTKRNLKNPFFSKPEAREYIKGDKSLKLPYICVREFQKNGNVHYHALIFGQPFLKDIQEIKKIWVDYCQGEQVDIQAVRFDPERGYVWMHDAPRDAAGRQPLEYLKKYLLKGQYTESGAMYWLNASRFFTYSPQILREDHRPVKIPSLGYYYFAGVVEGVLWDSEGLNFRPSG